MAPPRECDCAAEVKEAVAKTQEAAAKNREAYWPSVELMFGALPSATVARTWRIAREPKILFGIARGSTTLPTTKPPPNETVRGTRNADKLVVFAAREGKIETVFELRAGVMPGNLEIAPKEPLDGHIVALDAKTTEDGDLIVSAARGCGGTKVEGKLEPWASWDEAAARVVCAGVGRYRWNGRTFEKQR